MAQNGDSRVMCRDHGRMYDPTREAGCAVCRGEVDPAAQKEPERPWGKLAVAAVLLLLVATFFLRAEPEDRSEHEIIQMQAGPFRDEIEKLEYILFAESSYGPTDAEQIAFLSRKLAKEMRNWESRVHMLSHIGEVRAYADSVEHRAEHGFADQDLFACRDDWQRLRDKIFEPEPWFER